MIKQLSLQSRRRQSSAVARSHRGTLVICVVVCLLITGSLAGATTHAALQWRRSVRLEHQMLQTELLLDAGILRAAKQLRLSEDYTGETWRPSRDSIGFEFAVVEIRVNRGDDPSARQVEVVAELGAPLSELSRTNASHTRRSHAFSVQVAALPQNSDSSSVE